MDCTPIFRNALKASTDLRIQSVEKINSILALLADETEKNSACIIAENQKDLSRMDENDPRYDRLKLTGPRIQNIAADIRNVAGLKSPVGEIIYEYKKPNGLLITKARVPFGVIGVIYEARPNVTFDVFSLCLKSGNACILKGGSDAIYSNEAIVGVIKKVLSDSGLNQDIISLLPTGREARS
jgi:glutamate-5-semialdehyde dehydrogenase